MSTYFYSHVIWLQSEYRISTLVTYLNSYTLYAIWPAMSGWNTTLHTTVFETKMWQRQNFIRQILILAAHNFSEYLRRGLM